MTKIIDKNYWGIHMGKGNEFADVAHKNNFIAIGWNEVGKNLGEYKNLDRNEFFEKLDPIIGKVYRENSKNVRSAINGQLFRFSNLIKIGDVILMPKTDQGKLYIGLIDSNYLYDKTPIDGCTYQNKRKVKWIKGISLDDASQDLRNSIGSIMTIFSLSKHATEIESLIAGGEQIIVGQEVEDIKDFGMESHLEDFLIYNWGKLELSKKYDIYTENDELSGQQFVTDVGRIDILARGKDKKGWLVIELKKGRSSDAVVGQLLRYIGYVKKHMAQNDETVKGLLIAGEEDKNIAYAVAYLPNVEFMTYSVQFKLNSIQKNQ